MFNFLFLDKSINSPFSTVLPSTAQAPNSTGVEVAVDVETLKRRQAFAAIDISAGDTFTVVLTVRVLTATVGIFGHRRRNRRGGIGLLARMERVSRFHDAPAVVAAVFDQVDHFPEVLADVARPQIAGLAIEGELPDVAQADAVDLGRPVGVIRRAAHWVVLGNAVFFAVGGMIDVDAEDRGEPIARIWPVVNGSSAAPLSPSVI